jgi:hypothetical protein
MGCSRFEIGLLLALLVACCQAGSVLSFAQAYSINPTVTTEISNSYSLSDGFTWSRQRATNVSYNRFPEFYTLSLDAGCTIGCGPYSWPVIVGSRLFCERDLTKFTGPPPMQAQTYKLLCIPDISTGAGYCSLATHGLGVRMGKCDYQTASIFPFYAPYASVFDCCLNNANGAELYTTTPMSDSLAIIL